MALRRLFRCLERPSTDGLSAQDEWCNPLGHTATYCYQPFGGHWGTWHHVHINLDGPKEWVFKPFVDEQTMIGGRGRMIYKQHHMPQGAVAGSVWLCPQGSFKRVLSRGGAWENVTPGTKHPDERDHDDEQVKQESRPEAEREPVQVSSGTGESAPGDGDNGQVADAVDGPQDEGVALNSASHPEGDMIGEPPDSIVNPGSLETVEVETGPEGEGVDANGSPVV